MYILITIYILTKTGICQSFRNKNWEIDSLIRMFNKNYDNNYSGNS